MNKILLMMVLGLCSGMAAANGVVAEIGAMSGDVLVSHGGEYTNAQNGEALQAGDKIMVMDNSKATVSYGGECSVALSSGSVMTVAASGGCANTSVSRVPAATEAALSKNSNTGIIILAGVALVVAAVLIANGDDEIVYGENTAGN